MHIVEQLTFKLQFSNVTSCYDKSSFSNIILRYYFSLPNFQDDLSLVIDLVYIS